MTPRTEFVLLATLAGAVLSVLGQLGVTAFLSGSGPGGEALRTALLWSPGAALAAFAGSAIVSAWHRRVLRRGRRWGAVGLAVRTTVLALLVYPLALSAWLLFTAWLDQQSAAAPVPVRALLPWLPTLVAVAWGSALLVGALPAFALVFVLGRRYLRRLGRSAMETA